MAGDNDSGGGGVLDATQANSFLGLGRAMAAMTAFQELKAEWDGLRARAVAADDGVSPSEEEWQAFHLKGAHKALEVARNNGGIYVKAAQFVASLQGGSGDAAGLPRQYKEVLAVLTDEAPRQSYASVVEVINEEWAGRWKMEEVFESFEEEPVASASLAQVHRAVLRDGKEVAVKIQHRGLREQMASDFAVFENMAASMRPAGYDVSWLVKDLRTALNGELDFGQEARNTRRVHGLFKGNASVLVPDVIMDYSSGRVLITEWVSRLVKCNDAEKMKSHGIDPNRIGELIAETFSKMIFQYRFLHGDPHSGNVYARMVPEGSQLVVLDHGLYHTIDDATRRDFGKLYLACIACNPADIRKYAQLFAGEQLWKYFPLILSPWFIFGSEINLDDVRAAVEGRLPATVSAKDIADFLVGLHEGSNNILLLLHSIGYARGLLNDIKFSEKHRLKIIAREVSLGLDLGQAATRRNVKNVDWLSLKLSTLQSLCGPILLLWMRCRGELAFHIQWMVIGAMLMVFLAYNIPRYFEALVHHAIAI